MRSKVRTRRVGFKSLNRQRHITHQVQLCRKLTRHLRHLSRLIAEFWTVKLSPNVETKLLRRASRDRSWSMTRGRKNNDFRSNSRASPHMPSRFLQEGFQKRQHEDCRECASARECNLNHVGVFSMERAKLQFAAACCS